jgi:hypothetical protein
MEDDTPPPPFVPIPLPPESSPDHTQILSTSLSGSNEYSHHHPPTSSHSHSHDEDNRTIHFNRGQSSTICWFDPPCEPLTLNYFFSVRGQDGFHVYLWIMKDLSWVQAWYWCGLTFGTLTLIWSAFILWRACSRRSLDEIWTHSAQFMWLFGNFLWMQGELHDSKYPNETSIYNERADQAGYIFITALVWISIYYLIAKPLNITSSPEINAAYDTTGFQCRFPALFRSWREYENVHILFWIGKDCFWCWYVNYMWVLFWIPTLFVAFDFCLVSLRGKNMIIDHAHYISQLLWVSANAVWGLGEFWFSVNHDSALAMTAWNRDIRLTFRWYSAWVVVSAYVPLVLMYLIWIPSTIFGRIEDDEEEEGRKMLKKPLHGAATSATTTSPSLPHSNTKPTAPKATLFQQSLVGRIRAWSGAIGIQMSPSPTHSESTHEEVTGTTSRPNDEEKQLPMTHSRSWSSGGPPPSFDLNPVHLHDAY